MAGNRRNKINVFMKEKIMFFVFFSLVFFFFVPSVFAEDVSFVGRVDNMESSMAGSKIVFKDSVTNREVVTKEVDPFGNYLVYVPKGTYDIAIISPSGSEMKEVTKKKQNITSDTIANFSLPSSNPLYVNALNAFSNIHLYIVPTVLLILGICGGYLLVKK